MSDSHDIDPESALLDYIALGEKRSLQKLIDNYTNDGRRPPSLRTMKEWSTKNGWKFRVAEHEAQVSGLVQAMAIEGTAKGHLDLAGNIHVAGQKILDEIQKAIARSKVTEMSDIKTLSEVFVNISRHGLDIERGRPPSPQLLSEALRSLQKDGAPDGKVTEHPSSTPDAAPGAETILDKFEKLTQTAEEKAH